MSRRRILVVSSSDEENDQQPPPPAHQQEEEEEFEDEIIEDIEADLQTVTINSATPDSYFTASANSNRSGIHIIEPIPIHMSEGEEEITANGGASNDSGFNNVGASSGNFEASDSPVNGVLERMGLRLKREWMNSCLHRLESSVNGFLGMDDAMKAKLCFAQFLRSDMNYCGAGVLPPNVNNLHLVDLKGPFVLQVDEIVNISCPLRGRYQNAAAGVKRCLKLSMTDGVQRVFGMEYRTIKDIEVLAPAGMKVVICNVHVRRGLLMLVPEVLEVLGGSTEELEAARRKVVDEVNKPPRGKRNRTGVVPPLGTRATLAAWASHSDAAPRHVYNNNRDGVEHVQAQDQGNSVNTRGNDMDEQNFTTHGRHNTSHDSPAAPQSSGYGDVQRDNDLQPHISFRNASQRNTSARPAMNSPNVSNAEPTAICSSRSMQWEPSVIDATEVIPGSATNAQVASPSDNRGRGDHEIHVGRHIDEMNVSSSAVDMDTEEISMESVLEPHFVLPGDKEVPFIYLASLSAKFATEQDKSFSVRGIIKCFITGVKGFQYKGRDSYELRVYVDDGSLISEILIDHNAVENRIGYSPREVTNALASSDTKRESEMKQILKQFQAFLINFEGTMVMEMNKASPVPIAVEMKQGIPVSDTWLLLKRLTSSNHYHH